MSASFRCGAWTSSTPGLLCRDLSIRVPLDRSGAGDTFPNGDKDLTVYAREIARRQAHTSEADVERMPALLFLQGGPGCEAPRLDGAPLSSWLGALVAHHRVILLDQRGTGASTPIDDPLAGGDAHGTARLLSHMRADEIVEDCEDLRRALGIEQWSVLGQSFGGFCTVRYANAHPGNVEKIYLTGGLPAVGTSIDEVYALTYEAMRAKSEEFYTRYPGDRDVMAALLERAARGEVTTFTGERVGPERLRSVGSLLGASGGAEILHALLERDPSSWAFRYDLPSALAFGGRAPLYAVIHESCWVDGGVSAWAAQRVRPTVFDDDPTLLTGEHVCEEFFAEDATLRPWREVAELVAQQQWPRLYEPEALRTGGVCGAAAVYARDVYVPVSTSLATADLMPGVRTWVTSEYEHNGARASGGEVFRRLEDLAAGVIVR